MYYVNHIEAEEFRGMFNGASGMSKLDYNSLEFVDGNNAKFASFKQDKLNLFNLSIWVATRIISSHKLKNFSLGEWSFLFYLKYLKLQKH